MGKKTKCRNFVSSKPYWTLTVGHGRNAVMAIQLQIYSSFSATMLIVNTISTMQADK